ncbi:MAG: DUF4115 domain-containing protein [Alphaproteobacteria bacterium]|nr:DUF4115 domain-containing protein [Alphaproteobacteria bacterium]OJV47151.1 MAG: hypothetical protein BGO28_01785 [Alphaproteobacteria bacterium 43-37]
MSQSKKRVRQKVQVEQNPLFLGADDNVLPMAEGASGVRVSEFLKVHRLRNKLSLTKVSQELRIREDYLVAIEEEDQRRLPEIAYTLGFVRSYANFLGFDGAEVVKMYKVEQDFDRHMPEINDLVSQVSERSVPSKKVLFLAGAGIIAAIILGMYLVGGRTDNSSSQLATLNATSKSLEQSSQGEHPSVLKSEASVPEAKVGISESEASSQPELSAAGDSRQLKVEGTQPAKDEVVATQPSDTNQVSKSSKDTALLPLSNAQLQPGVESINSAAELPPLANGPALLVAQDTAWVRIFYADGRIVSDRVMRPGETMNVQLGQKLFLSTGNLGALQIDVDGKSYFLKGKAGEIKRNIPLEADILNDYVLLKKPASH